MWRRDVVSTCCWYVKWMQIFFFLSLLTAWEQPTIHSNCDATSTALIFCQVSLPKIKLRSQTLPSTTRPVASVQSWEGEDMAYALFRRWKIRSFLCLWLCKYALSFSSFSILAQFENVFVPSVFRFGVISFATSSFFCCYLGHIFLAHEVSSVELIC